jgi:hypothetical protein
MSEISTYVQQARDLIADIDNWIQDMAASNGEIEVEPSNTSARFFCADGALTKTCGDPPNYWGYSPSLYLRCSKAVDNAADELYGKAYIDVNDGNADLGLPETASDEERRAACHAAVLACFDLAITRAADPAE